MEIKNLANVINTVANLDKQIAYAASFAINQQAKAIQNKEYEESNKAFTIRKNWNKPRTKYGFNVEFASKTNLRAVVFSRAPWLELQEFGGTKKTDKGKYQPLLIPAKEIQQKKGRLVDRKIAVSTLKNNPTKAKAFQINGNWYQRTGPKTIRPLFFKEFSASIKPRFPFTAIGEEMIDREYSDRFSSAFAYAMKTAF